MELFKIFGDGLNEGVGVHGTAENFVINLDDFFQFTDFGAVVKVFKWPFDFFGEILSLELVTAGGRESGTGAVTNGNDKFGIGAN